MVDKIAMALRKSGCKVVAIVNGTIYVEDGGRQWAVNVQLRQESSVITCNYCGMIDWTQDRYGQILHKHNCPNREDDKCQTHPTGCPVS